MMPDKIPNFEDDQINETYALHSQLLVPYLPTPMDLIRKIFRRLRLPRNSLFYDLGSGDGRVVVMGAMEFGLKAIGFEINKGLFQESLMRLNKCPTEIKKRIRFHMKDFFDLDLTDAKAVFVYCTPGGIDKLKHVLCTADIGTKFIFPRFELPELEALECGIYRSDIMHENETGTDYKVFFYEKLD